MILPADEGKMCLLLFLALSIYGICSFSWPSQVVAQVIEPPDTSKYTIASLNLLESKYDWQPVNKIDIERMPTEMNLTVDTTQTSEIYHRASMQNNISGIPTYLNVTYSSGSSDGDAIYGISIRDLRNSKLFWARLNDTGGQTFNQRVYIPENPFFNNFENRAQTLEFWLTIITDQPGIHYLNFSGIRLATSPNYLSLGAAMPWLFLF